MKRFLALLAALLLASSAMAAELGTMKGWRLQRKKDTNWCPLRWLVLTKKMPA